MRVSDYIVSYLKENGIKDFFGYQGTMISYFVDAIGKNKDVKNYVCYNEQGAALEAVGYAKTSGGISCAYSTSGPGATNLITGIADAYYDSVPVLFITGQLNTYEYTNVNSIRQQGFQESDIVSIIKPITKYAVKIENENNISYELEKALYIMQEGRPGPVLLDLPMNIQKSNIDISKVKHFEIPEEKKDIDYLSICENILNEIENSKRPVLFLGNGIKKDKKSIREIRNLINKLKIPVIYSMLGKSLIEEDSPYNFGFMGSAYGQRYSNLIGYKKADLIVSLGCRLNGRTIGIKRNNFNPSAKIIRVEIDKEELKLPIHSDDIAYNIDVNKLIKQMNVILLNKQINEKREWLNICQQIKDKLKNIDNDIKEWLPNRYISLINEITEDDSNIFVDVGQNQVWAAHSIKIKKNQKIIFSGGLGAMGFALPASIGGCISANKKNTYVIVGDGGLQMNIQELQLLKHENLPITIFVFNNESLGLIHQQQSDFFDNKYYGACCEGGYSVPDFCKIADAYGIKSYQVNTLDKFKKIITTYDKSKPTLIEIKINIGTKAYPKTYFGEEMYNQVPYISKDILDELLKL